MEISCGKEQWTVQSFVYERKSEKTINFDELNTKDKIHIAEKLNEKALKSLGYERIKENE